MPTDDDAAADRGASRGGAAGYGIGGRLRRQRGLAVVRVAFGLAWATDATLKWLPGFADGSFMGKLEGARDGQPAVVKAWINVWIDLFSTNPHVWAHVLGTAESLIAICLILGAFTNVVCVLGGLLSLGIWTTAEGLGGPYTSGSTDINASIIYVMVFAVLGLTAAGGSWGADRWLRPRLGSLRWLCAQPATPAGGSTPARRS